jgi:preprotein translocase subunit SecF
MINIIGKRFWFYILSALILVPGIISLIAFGLNLGVEFQSGTSMTLRFDKSIDQSQLRDAFAAQGHNEATIQKTGEGDYLIRVKEISPDERQTLKAGLEKTLGSTITIRDYFTVSPVIATETGRDAAIAVLIAAVFMLLYIVWAFRNMPNPFRWGTCAIIALLHDVIVVLGIFSLLGFIAHVQVDALFITGMLTVVGYSINNTVVVYDRIRENISKGISKDMEKVVNISVVETMGRCLNTSLTTLFVILAIFLFGGVTIHYFILCLLLGVLVGLYDSICISGSLLVTWEKGGFKGLFSRPEKKAA